MESILLEPKTKEDAELIKKMAKKMRIKSSVLTQEDKEDIGLGIAIQKGRTGKFVSKETIMKKLSRWWLSSSTYHFSSVFPNPVSNISFLQIQTQNNPIKQVDFFDQLGRKISTVNSPNQFRIPINKEKFSDGIFFYRIRLLNGTTDSGSFIVE